MEDRMVVEDMPMTGRLNEMNSQIERGMVQKKAGRASGINRVLNNTQNLAIVTGASAVNPFSSHLLNKGTDYSRYVPRMSVL